MRRAAILLHPASSEQFGLVLVEAMCLGTPVVASAASGPSNVLAGRGVLVPVDRDGPLVAAGRDRSPMTTLPAAWPRESPAPSPASTPLAGEAPTAVRGLLVGSPRPARRRNVLTEPSPRQLCWSAAPARGTRLGGDLGHDGAMSVARSGRRPPSPHRPARHHHRRGHPCRPAEPGRPADRPGPAGRRAMRRSAGRWPCWPSWPTSCGTRRASGPRPTLRRPTRSRPYIDRAAQLDTPPPDRLSFYTQPWRGFQETIPAARFLAGIGVNYNLPDGTDDAAIIAVLAEAGIRSIRLELGWGSAIGEEDTVRDESRARIRRILTEAKGHGITPMILLNANQGEPAPTSPRGGCWPSRPGPGTAARARHHRRPGRRAQRALGPDRLRHGRGAVHRDP